MKNKIIRFIKKEVKRSKAKGVVLGLSGGVDSAVVAVLCAQALGKDRVLCLILPCGNQKQDSLDARALVKKFKLNARVIDLEGVYRAYMKILPKAGRMASANLKARLRMTVIYYFANKFNYLVCGTSNRSERMVGYFTKFGDGAADFLPLGALLKKQVRQLAAALNIHEDIITKAPTAGLWPGQTDEKELGMSYNDLDDILLRLQKRQKQACKSNLVQKVKSSIESSQHKRRLPPICAIYGQYY